MTDALDAGASLILFPEGTRNMTEERLLPFKSGLYHLAMARPQVELVPVWLENLNRDDAQGRDTSRAAALHGDVRRPAHDFGAARTKPRFSSAPRAALLAAASARAAAQ